MLHLFINKVLIIENNIKDFLGIFTNSAGTINPEKKLRILIFNWRDIRHKWAGGAEVYVHEIAKRWAAKGNDVTIFCGNDAHCSRYQVIDKVQIVRRGGFYTVYFWAFVYYMLKFRGKFDVIVDSANGIPFLTQLYAGKPVYLLIHHVHQEVFKKYLTFIKSKFALFVEGKIMPFIYKNNIIITVSDSSKKELLKLGFKNPDNISVVHPGIDNNLFFKLEKSKHPLVIYLGRIMRYKNIDVLIKAFKNVVSIIPDAKLLIAGEGESKKDLIALTEELRLTDHIQFLGKVTDSAKLLLLGTSWVSVQPSQVEGWGITVIEANASGTPVIASNVNGLRDSIVDGQTGILVQPNNVEKFSEALCTVLSDKNFRLNLSQEAYEWSKNFNWELSADKFYDLVIDNIDAQTEIGMQSDYAVQKIENI